ncbi:hypothetical protein BDK51DRAFT_51594 [Blyttiomyces helicus]|uniref:Uncharacterized protein n=1 Tax=Blyttiomyces helicus TaxID=388810 RepID=A0A4P9WHP3_9FUNG|nr:hypothetical protein BDK51DRAFT_51594 [Blyttiomyces helicus]|eukprot:RKO91475.1 hypothetical protein BDK51DRAFT_51594 [Blyttiomyces helicus]
MKLLCSLIIRLSTLPAPAPPAYVPSSSSPSGPPSPESIIVLCNNHVRSISTSDPSKNQWKLGLHGAHPREADMMVDGSTLFVIVKGKLQAVDVASGRVKWSNELPHTGYTVGTLATPLGGTGNGWNRSSLAVRMQKLSATAALAHWLSRYPNFAAQCRQQMHSMAPDSCRTKELKRQGRRRPPPESWKRERVEMRRRVCVPPSLKTSSTDIGSPLDHGRRPRIHGLLETKWSETREGDPGIITKGAPFGPMVREHQLCRGISSERDCQPGRRAHSSGLRAISLRLHSIPSPYPPPSPIQPNFLTGTNTGT